jgi:predicted transposase YdaD
MEMNWVDRLETKYLNAGRREGRKEGRREGREQGRLEGVRQLLLRQMALRFGPLPEAIRAQVEAVSSLTLLNRLAEKVVVAQSLEEMGLR